MKTKYLFGMLLSGALLAACTAEDDLNTSVVREANPSAPVFTVSFDGADLQNRGYYNPDGNKVGFEENDKLSLYHGIPNSSWLTGWQNAIYIGGDDGEGKFTFTTQSMVSPDYAIMVYPANLESYNETGGDNLGINPPILSVPSVQKPETKDNTPYISEILYIRKPTSAGVPAEAGYGKTYNIVLKRAATTLTLNTTRKNEPAYPSDVKANEMYKVELTANQAMFTTEAAIMTNGVRPVANDGTNATAAYHSWVLQPELTTWTNRTNIATEDIEDGATAYFTLLKSSVGTVSDGSITAYTRYGQVVMTKDTSNDGKVWTKKDGTKIRVDEGLDFVRDHLWVTASATSGVFEGETIGSSITASMAFDMSKLDMNYLHIKDEQHLIDALKVYNSLQPQEKILNPALDKYFYLDGTKGVFEMHKEAWEAVVNQLNKSGNKIHFVPCQYSGENCTTVKLINDGAEEEVPELRFDWYEATVELVGNWKYESIASDNASKGQYRKLLQNVKEIKVKNNLTLKNYINAIPNNVKITIAEGGVANVTGIVVLQAEMENFGTINIPAGVTNRLAVDATGKLVNREAQNPSNTVAATAFDDGAVINNGSTLAIIDQSGGEIYNYGIINLLNGEARTLITANADGNVGTQFAAGGNKIGTINLYEKTGGSNNTKILNATSNSDDAAGFIKIKASQAGTGGYGTVANYVILDGSVDTYAGSAAIKYVEIQSSKEVVFDNTKVTTTTTGTGANAVTTTVDGTLRGLIVPAGKSANIPLGKTVVVTDHVYVKGTITRAGTFDYTSATFVGYFKGSNNDKNNIFSFQ